MVKVILCAHGEFATSLLKSAEMITGPLQGITAISFYPSEGMEDLKQKIETVVKEYENNELIIITDLKGGTPCNVSFLLSKQYNFTLLSGLNLPILLEASFLKDIETSSSILGEKLLEVGSTSIQKIL